MEWYENITPTEFEMLCMLKLREFGEQQKLPKFKITHNEIVKGSDGEYQVDILASFTALIVDFTILCECKRYKNKVPRDRVMVLHQRLSSCGAHKGILMAVNGFQSGAIEYAQEHGIALINIEPPDGNSSAHVEYIISQNSPDYDPSHNPSTPHDPDYSPRLLKTLSMYLNAKPITALLTEEEQSVLRLERVNGEQKRLRLR